MKILNTKLYFRHKELIEIFLQANNFTDYSVQSYTRPDEFSDIELIQIQYQDNDDGMVMSLALKHYGILNMFDHYLMKCGVHYSQLSPPPMLSTEQALDIVLKEKENT